MSSKTVYIKLIGDALIPILGFFFWNWSLYFIVLFYILDLLVREALVHFKTKKLQTYSEKVIPNDWILNGVKSGFLLVSLLTLVHILILFLHPNILFKEEITYFLTYKEMGVPQGLVLIPLVVFIGYANYQNEFIRPKLFSIIDFSSLWKIHLVELVLLIGCVLVCIAIAYMVKPPEWLYLVVIIGAISAYNYYSFKKRSE